MRRPLGCLTGSALVALIVTLVAVGVAAAASGNGIFSPGGLNASRGQNDLGGVQSHADLARRCAACHAPFWSADSMGDRCLACHTEVNAELSDPHSLHFGIAVASTCRNCHTEHHGPQGVLTKADMTGFPHGRFGFSLKAHPMSGSGGTFLCSDCHGASVRTVNVSTCEDCHRTLDAGFMARHVAAFGPACLTCHDGLDTYGKSFNHNLVAFHLEGAHAKLDCAECHAGATTIAALRQAPKQCVACHLAQDIHQGRLGKDCGGCHKPTRWKDASLEDHAVTGFALVGSHLTVQCQACHVGDKWTGIPTSCAGCHTKDDPHGGQFKQDCGACHVPTTWSDVTFDHSKSAFPLVGAHLIASCTSCHAGGKYVGTPTACVACHAKDDPHGGQFRQDCSACHRPTTWSDITFDHSQTSFPLVGAHALASCASCHAGGKFVGTPTQCIACHAKDDKHQGAFGTDCSLCHRPTTWSDITFDHNKSRFPLTGAHRSLACQQCHAGGVFKGLSTACASCHGEPAIHKGLFGTNCAACHSTSAWLPASFNGPHVFPLNHGGANGNCAKCHPNGLTSYTCFQCHNQAQTAASHAEHGISNISNCVACHPTGKAEGGDGGGGGGGGD